MVVYEYMKTYWIVFAVFLALCFVWWSWSSVVTPMAFRGQYTMPPATPPAAMYTPFTRPVDTATTDRHDEILDVIDGNGGTGGKCQHYRRP
jgi:hypothetical protein